MPKPWKDVAVGDTVWIRDTNRASWRWLDRVAAPTERVRDRSAQYSEHTVVGMNHVSLELSGGMSYKVSRTDGRVRGEHCSTLSATLDRDGDIYIEENRHKVAEAVRECSDAEVLREVARLLGTVQPKADAE